MRYFFIFSISVSVLAVACTQSVNTSAGTPGMSAPAQQAQAPADTASYGPLDTATVAAGCFWCVEAVFESIKGVKEAESGYAGGHTKNPTYEQVGSQQTGHAETVQIYYDPKQVAFKTLLEVYFGSMNPTQVNGQGPDHGSAYRSIIFYRNETERATAEKMIAELNASGQYDSPVAVAVEPFKIFYLAEAYHQNYETLHPENPYVRNVSIPRLNRMKARFPQLLKGE